MRGWILYKRSEAELRPDDHGVHRLRESAKTLGIHLAVYKPEQFNILVSSLDNGLWLNGEPCVLPDIVIPRIGAEISYLGLTILRQLEQQGVLVCNDALSISRVKDKMGMSQLLMGQGFPTPKTLFVQFPLSVDFVQQTLGFPVVIKTISGARGHGVCLCESASDLNDLMALLSLQSGSAACAGLILQEFIANSYGRDLRVFVLGDQVIGCMQRLSQNGFKANYSLGGRVEPYPMTPLIESLALSTARLFGLHVAGIDLLFQPDGTFTICEANSSPGFKGMELATGTDIAMKIMAYIKTIAE